MKKKCIGTQLCGPQTCVPMFLFVILSFCHFCHSLRRELRGMPTFVELLSGSGHLTVQKWTLALIVGTHFQMVMCLVHFL